jgi:pyruvate,water dikinase
VTGAILTMDRATDPAVAGGKAAALARLAAAGFDVPPFVVIPATALGPEGALPDLAQVLKPLGPGPYAVRSSGRAEDGAAHSHAGQFKTVLNVPAAEVAEAARQVWQSGFADGIAAYRALTDAGAAEAPSVIVQAMVPARVAGVAFSADPVAGVRGRAVVSAVVGLGEALVSGEADGEDWTIAPDGTVLAAPDTAAVLTQAEAVAVADLARRAEAAFGAPQDIEWAYEGARLFLLQSRPITTPLRDAALPDNAMTVLDNSNIVESYPGLVSPLTYSFARAVYGRVYRAFVRLLGVRSAQISAHAAVFDNMLARVDGRVYYNLGNWYRALALLPGFALNRAHMETMMGVEDPLPQALSVTIGPPPAQGWARLAEAARLAPVAVGLLWQALCLPRTRAGFYRRLDAALTGGIAPDRANLTELAAEYRRIETLLLDRWDAPLVNDFLCMMAFGASRKVLLRWGGQAGAEAHNAMMIGQGDIISAEPARRVARLGAMVAAAGVADSMAAQGREGLRDHPKIAAEYDDYLRKFGDRCTQELKLESLPLTLDDAPLVAAVLAAARRGAVPETEVVAPDWTLVLPGRPLRRALARALTGYAAARVRDRENLRFERTRIFGHARRVFLAMGAQFVALGLLNAPRDVLYLTVDEVLGAVEGNGLGGDLRSLAALRRTEAEAAARRPDPAERIVLTGAVRAVGLYQTAPVPEVGDIRHGTGCSAGIVTARARVIHDPRQQALVPGEILVARNTDPGWIAVFANASAIVVERGSLLSHSAIVARELGIPCVVGIRRATDWLADGELITVNGQTGEVRRQNGTG